ncbi:MAG TPA: RNA polymerase-associated protein RapA [Gammaproteobacteria bacterium]|nr:RNA polymerase-associated protein RapA [Gammaproteobacteria bacterium]
MAEFIPGQRWISSAELQMGLGTIVSVDFRTIDMVFLATGEMRTYAKQTAPLSRVSFVCGDKIKSHEGWALSVSSVDEKNGLLTYRGYREDGSDASLEESDLDNFIQLNKPTERLFTGQIDRDKWFELRYQTRFHQSRTSHSALRGLAGGRTSLIPHQLYIAHEVANRYAPRVLLADEVGLGKTIEAGMILHQQLITERASRVLIIVPETLLHQWLVEMLRRFNLFFSIFDEDRCLAVEESTALENPFHSGQLALCTLEFLTTHGHRFQQALAGEWDMLVVDEAHHLQWSPDQPSIEYTMIEQLATQIKGVLLLTATPEQLGRESHFARLRLLDADRFPDLDTFLDEEKNYGPIAKAVTSLLNGEELDTDSYNIIQETVQEGDNMALLKTLQNPASTGREKEQAQRGLVEHLLDRHGTGRVLFRNTRSAIQGFPERKVCGYPLPLPGQYADCLAAFQTTGITAPQQLLCPELLYQSLPGSSAQPWSDVDPRIGWLIKTLQKLKADKVLVITADAGTAIELVDLLRIRAGIHAASFHEGLSIVERDRAAAFFADREYGSQVLICSEIGSEGRNFQFSHHLILFDLPLNPDLLEQRIGRLDRIGQTDTIQIHVPYLENSAQDILYHWYHEGLNAFEQTCPAGHIIFMRVQETLVDALHQIDEGIEDSSALITTTRQLNLELTESLQRGRDQLLEYNSCRPLIAESIKNRAQQEDNDPSLLEYLENCFDCFGVDFEDHSENCYIARPGDHMQTGGFPGLHEEGMTVTCDRDTALSNEDIHFITWEHPLLTGAIDLVLSSELGNTAVTALKNSDFRPGTLLLECLFTTETSQDDGSQAGHSLPPVMIRTLIDQQGNDHESGIGHQAIHLNREKVNTETANKIVGGYSAVLKNMVTNSEKMARSQSPEKVYAIHQKIIGNLEKEVNRLKALQKINPNVRDEEVRFFEDRLANTVRILAATNLRLDAVRVIVTI